MMTELLSDSRISAELTALPRWNRFGAEIRAEYRAVDFVGAIALVDAVAAAAEAAGHHPDIDIRYDQVVFILSSHSDGGLTSKDFALASSIDAAADALRATPAD